MKKLVILLAALGLFAGVFLLLRKPAEATPPSGEETSLGVSVATSSPLSLLSSAFGSGERIPEKYTCDGANVSPPLSVRNVPDDAKSLVIIFDDPDSKPTPWVHWTLWNVSPTTTEISENSIPWGAIQGLTSFKNNKYGGSCPPRGVHHYSFRLYALSSLVDLPSSSSAEKLREAIDPHVLARSELVGLYSRK